MGKLSNKELTLYDLREIATRMRKFEPDIKKIVVHASKMDVLKICRDEQTHKHIDVIRSASIDIDNIRFELILTK